MERHKDLYYHDLMQLRREQQLEQMNITPAPVEVPVTVRLDYEPATVQIETVKEPVMTCHGEGPSSRDWMLVLMMVVGAAGLTLVLCILAFIALMSMGMLGAGGMTGGGMLVQ